MSQIFLNSGTLVILCPFATMGSQFYCFLTIYVYVYMYICRYVYIYIVKSVQCKEVELIVDKIFRAFQRAGL